MQIGKVMIQGGASTSDSTKAVIICVHMWLLWEICQADMPLPSPQNTNVQYKVSGMWLIGMLCLLYIMPSIILSNIADCLVNTFIFEHLDAWAGEEHLHPIGHFCLFHFRIKYYSQLFSINFGFVISTMTCKQSLYAPESMSLWFVLYLIFSLSNIVFFFLQVLALSFCCAVQKYSYQF